jgi:hypothetical protein
MNIVLQGLNNTSGRERKRAGWVAMTVLGRPGQGMGRYLHKGFMGAGSVCFHRPGRNLKVRVGREEEGAR